MHQQQFFRRRAEYTVRNVETTTALFRANTSYMVVLASLLVITSYFLPLRMLLCSSFAFINCFLILIRKEKNKNINLQIKSNNQTCDLSGFSWFQDFFSNLSFASTFSWRKRSSDQVSCLWGCWESVNPQKFNNQEVQGDWFSRPNWETQARYPFYHDFVSMWNHNAE